MKQKYNNAYEMMSKCDESLSKYIKEFVEKFPQALSRKIELGNETGIVVKNEKRWEFQDNGHEFSVSVGHPKNDNKDYMSVLFGTVTNDDLSCWPRFESERSIGYITFYLYDMESKRKLPIQARYDFVVKKVNGKVMMFVITNINAAYKEVAEKLDAYGLREMHENVIQRSYVIDTKAILDKNRSKK